MGYICIGCKDFYGNTYDVTEKMPYVLMIGKKFEILEDSYLYEFKENCSNRDYPYLDVILSKNSFPYGINKTKIGSSHDGIILLKYIPAGTKIEIKKAFYYAFFESSSYYYLLEVYNETNSFYCYSTYDIFTTGFKESKIITTHNPKYLKPLK